MDYVTMNKFFNQVKEKKIKRQGWMTGRYIIPVYFSLYDECITGLNEKGKIVKESISPLFEKEIGIKWQWYRDLTKTNKAKKKDKVKPPEENKYRPYTNMEATSLFNKTLWDKYYKKFEKVISVQEFCFSTCNEDIPFEMALDRFEILKRKNEFYSNGWHPCGELKDKFKANKSKPEIKQEVAEKESKSITNEHKVGFCQKKYKEEYYKANKERLLKKHKEYQQTNKKKINTYAKKYYAANRDNILNKKRKSRQANKARATNKRALKS